MCMRTGLCDSMLACLSAHEVVLSAMVHSTCLVVILCAHPHHTRECQRLNAASIRDSHLGGLMKSSEFPGHVTGPIYHNDDGKSPHAKNETLVAVSVTLRVNAIDEERMMLTAICQSI
jgi:hypothetical protein